MRQSKSTGRLEYKVSARRGTRMLRPKSMAIDRGSFAEEKKSCLY
jgi:hypothetical protein